MATVSAPWEAAEMMTVGELLAYLKLDDNPFKRALATARARFNAWGAATAQDADRHGQNAGKIYGRGFFFASDGSLRNKKGQFVGAEEAARIAGERAGRGFGRRMLDLLGDGLRGIGSLFSMAFSKASGALDGMSFDAAGLASFLMKAVAFATLLGPALYLAGGLAGSLPALLSGAGFAFGAVMLGMKGVTDAFKKNSGAGAKVADTAHQIAMAQRQVTRANKDLQAATEGINQARRDEIKHIRDLNLQLQRSALNEEDAASSVAEARDELARARLGGDPNEIARADRNLRSAQLTLEETKNAHSDLKEEKEESDRVGVEGSDRVREAIDRQAQAVDALADAQYALAQAQQAGSGGGAAGEVTKLAKSAQDFVDKVKSLGKAWGDLRLDVQQHLFEGIGDAVVKLADAWEGPARKQLTSMADTINGIVKTFTNTASKPKFIDDMNVGLDATRGFIDKIGNALAGPFMNMWARLSKAAKPFIDMLGDKLSGWIEDFAGWIDSVAENGKLDAFFQEATDSVSALFDIVEILIKIFGDLFDIIFGGQLEKRNKDEDPLVAVRRNLEKLEEWLSDPKNQESLKAFFDGLRAFLQWLFTDGVQKIQGFFGIMQWLVDKFTGWKNDLSDFKNDVKSKLDQVGGFFEGLRARLSATQNLFSWLPGTFKDALNQVIGLWNRLSFNLPAVDFMGAHFGGGSVGMPKLPMLAAGAMVGRRNGGTLAVIGEGREDEMVAPVSTAQGMIRQAVRDELAAADFGGGGDVVFAVDGEVIERRALRALRRNAAKVAAAAKAGDRNRRFAGGAAAALA
ncbi:hypothetical protein [Dactylosporangium sp. CS-033363]|uniref:hypothetical protein n=1 Tax=Dactylosporangium sp. CS-033363 TaxID=3239935 RepID=UPI003D8D36FA